VTLRLTNSFLLRLKGFEIYFFVSLCSFGKNICASKKVVSNWQLKGMTHTKVLLHQHTHTKVLKKKKNDLQRMIINIYIVILRIQPFYIVNTHTHTQIYNTERNLLSWKAIILENNWSFYKWQRDLKLT
jgi:L-cystine uptake protein TcyP (sodium:dicarboxylate symporter family)